MGVDDIGVDIDGDGDTNDGVRSWHFVPDDGDMVDGTGEGWVEWREAERGALDGRFVVHDVGEGEG
jgi:hypothetical protein